jgi:hypothetical protein
VEEAIALFSSVVGMLRERQRLALGEWWKVKGVVERDVEIGGFDLKLMVEEECGNWWDRSEVGGGRRVWELVGSV